VEVTRDKKTKELKPKAKYCQQKWGEEVPSIPKPTGGLTEKINPRPEADKKCDERGNLREWRSRMLRDKQRKEQLDEEKEERKWEA